MQLTEDSSSQNTIKSYSDGVIVIAGKHYNHSIIVTTTTLQDDWQPQRIDALQREHLKPILSLNPKIVIIGTGDQQHFIDPAILSPLFEKKIGVEIMNTHAACRTFNVLVSEGRDVLAALMI